MTSVYRVYGMEFLGKRSNIAFPLASVDEISQGDNRNKPFPATGYEAGSLWASGMGAGFGAKLNFSEKAILEAYGISETNPLEMRFENAVLLNDQRVAQFVSDFIAGYEDYSLAHRDFYRAQKSVRAARATATAYGITSYPVDVLKEKIEHLLNEEILFSLPDPMNKPIEGLVAMTPHLTKIENVLAESTEVEISLVFPIPNPLGQDGKQGPILAVRMLADGATVDQINILTQIYNTHLNIVASLVEEKMFRRFRNEGIMRLLAEFSNPETIEFRTLAVVPNIYNQK